MKKTLFLIAVLVCCFFCLQCVIILNQFDGDFISSYEDVNFANKNNTFGPFVRSELEEDSLGVSGQKSENGFIVFKLFGLIPIKKVAVRLASENDYYVGGVPVGFEIASDGLIVAKNSNENRIVKKGDIITKIDGKKVSSFDEVEQTLQAESNDLEIEVLRNNKTIKTRVKKLYDENQKRYKLGIWAKDEVSGVGTLTFVDTKSLEYGALGHAVVDVNGQNIVPVEKGKLFDCKLIGIEKGKKDKPGQLRCVLVPSMNGIGDLKENTKFGISGVLQEKDGIVDENVTAKLGGRLGVKMGKAKIISAVSGIRQEYEIEIIKANYQKSAKDKSIVFRVTDKRLLGLTGGIVQGMSGSPIMQDGKIVGAVTHVFTSAPDKGYGVYVDWMI